MRIVHKIAYGRHSIAYEVVYSARKTLEISVLPDLSVVVKAPQERSVEEVEAKVKKRAGWIVRQKQFFSMFLPAQPERRYVSGESHTYLGRRYRLKVVECGERRVVLKGGYIWLYAPDKNDTESLRAQLDKWYRERAVVKFEERLQLAMEKLGKYGVKEPVVQVRKMTSRWGSCSEKGRITLNTLLVKAPTQCIDYVITHELCHLLHFGHSRKFYELMSVVMPDWEERKSRLERVV